MSRLATEVVARLSEDEARALDMVIRGWTVTEVVKEFEGRLPIHRLRNLLRHHAEAIRARCAETVASRMVTHDTLLADLIERLYQDLLLGFCKDRAGMLVKYLERQARLLGLDAGGKPLGSSEFLSEASDQEILAHLRERYGVDLRSTPGAPK